MAAIDYLNNQRNQESALEHVFNTVISAIIDGELKPGDKLPTEPELSQKLGVGRNTVREAVKILEAYGVISIHRPEGTFVNSAYSHEMLNPMLYGLLLKQQDWKGLVEMRGALEIGTLFLACHSVTSSDIQALETIIGRMDHEIHKASPVVDKLIEYDRCFHGDIIKITGNPMIQDVSEYITKFTIHSRVLTTERIIASGETGPFIQKHRDIVEILRGRNVGDIETVVRSHYEYWQENI